MREQKRFYSPWDVDFGSREITVCVCTCRSECLVCRMHGPLKEAMTDCHGTSLRLQAKPLCGKRHIPNADDLPLLNNATVLLTHKPSTFAATIATAPCHAAGPCAARTGRGREQAFVTAPGCSRGRARCPALEPGGSGWAGQAPHFCTYTGRQYHHDISPPRVSYGWADPGLPARGSPGVPSQHG